MHTRRSGIRRSLTARKGLAGGIRDEDMQLCYHVRTSCRGNHPRPVNPVSDVHQFSG